MNRRFPALLALVGAMVLAACDSDNTPQPTATTAPAAPTTAVEATATTAAQAPTATTAPPAEQPSNTAAPAEATATTPAPPEATATAAPPAADEPLTLSPVTVQTTDATRKGVFAQERTINLPPGFQVNMYAVGIQGVRMLGLSPDGVLYATSPNGGRVVTLPDANNDGVADEIKTFADNLGGVHGIAFKDKSVFVATESSIFRLEDSDGDGVADKRDRLANDLPSGGGHSTRTIAFGPDGKLYVSAGSSCNVCRESNEKRAAISRYSAEGQFEKVFAAGLRNAVGIVFHPETGELWATNNGRDGLGDNVPPETIYNVKEDANYGWPFCYGARTPDQSQNPPAGFCEKTGVPAVEMQAHSAPLGLVFYTGDQFPAQFKGDLFVAFHGSWNRSEPTGYKVVRVRFADNQPDQSAGDLLVEDFATGWLTGGDAWGRPVDPFMAPDGALLVTDDRAGAIYRISFAAPGQ